MKKIIMLIFLSLYGFTYAQTSRPSFEELYKEWLLKNPSASSKMKKHQEKVSLTQQFSNWWHGNDQLSNCEDKLKAAINMMFTARVNEQLWKKRYETLKNQETLKKYTSNLEPSKSLGLKTTNIPSNLERTVRVYTEAAIEYLQNAEHKPTDVKYNFTVTGANRNDLPTATKFYTEIKPTGKITFTLQQNPDDPTQFTLTGKLINK